MSQLETSIRNRLLKALSPADLDLLSPHLNEVEFAVGEVLAESGSVLSDVHFINRGIISLIADRADDRIEVGMLGRESMTNAAAGFGARSNPYKLLCQAECNALQISADAFEAATQRSPTLAALIGRYLHALGIQTAQTAYSNASLNIEARLARWVLMTDDRLDEFALPLTHEFLATMLGTRRAGVTTAVHLLEGAGTVRAERGTITILNRAKLEELADDAYGLAEAEYDRLIGVSSQDN